MNPARIAELLDPFLRAPLNPCHAEAPNAGDEPAVLSLTQLQSISTYIDILIRWNSRINLTAIRDPEDIVPRHFGESLFAARHLFPTGVPGGSGGESARGSESADAKRSESQSTSGNASTSGRAGGRAALQGRVTGHEKAGALAPAPVANDQRPTTNDRIADLGSGAGFPGLPIKLWAPNISLTLIESNHKKAAFLREVTRALTLTNVDIQNTRAETLTTAYDVVTLRAVEHFETILPTAAALLAPTGRLALLISAAQQDQARASLPHLAWSPAVPVPHSRSRILLTASRI